MMTKLGEIEDSLLEVRRRVEKSADWDADVYHTEFWYRGEMVRNDIEAKLKGRDLNPLMGNF